MTLGSFGTINDLDDVKRWLGGFKPDQSTTLNPSQFRSQAVAQLLRAVNKDDDYSVTFKKINAEKASFTARAEFIEKTGCELTFAFQQKGDEELLLDVTVAKIPDYTLDIASGYKLVVADPEFTLNARPFPPSVQLSFDGALVFGKPVAGAGSLDFKLPVHIDVPPDPVADWRLSLAQCDMTLSDDILADLWGDNTPRSLMPAELTDGFALTLLEISFNASTKSCSFIRLGLAYKASWSFFGDIFKVHGGAIEVSAFAPFGGRRKTILQGRLESQLSIGSETMTLGAQIVKPLSGKADIIFYASLTTGAALSINTLFTDLKLTLPDGFPDVELSALSLLIRYTQQSALFQMAIDKTIKLSDHISLENCRLDVTADYKNETARFDDTRKVIKISAGFQIDTTKIKLSGKYDTEKGYSLSGSVKKMPMKGFVDFLQNNLDIPADQIPDTLHLMTIDELSLAYSKEKKKESFKITLAVGLPFDGLDVGVTLKVALTRKISAKGIDDAAPWDVEFSGDVALSFSNHAKVSVGIDFKSSKEKTIFTHYHGGESAIFKIGDLAEICKFDCSGLPDDLNVGVARFGFVYNFTNNNYAFGMTLSGTAKLGCSLVSLRTKSEAANDAEGARRYAVVLSTSPQIDLLGLPLLKGIELHTPETLQLHRVRVAFASSPTPTRDEVTAINTLIGTMAFSDTVARPKDQADSIALPALVADKEGRSPFPTLPSDGLEGRCAIAFSFLIGDDKPRDVQVVVLRDKKTAAKPTTGDDGETKWFNVEKSLGPITLHRGGFRYADNKLLLALDAGLAVGPLSFEIMELGAEIDVKTFKPRFLTKGLTAGYNSPAFSLAGGFYGSFDPVDLYGELSVSVGKFGIGALAGYAQFANSPSLFLYGAVSLPLGGDPSCFVTGLAAGFGFNRDLHVPEVDTLHDFPLISWAMGAAPPQDPKENLAKQVADALKNLARFIEPKIGQYWGAVGVRFTTYKLVDSFLLLTVGFGDNFEIDLLGLSRLKLPPTLEQAAGGGRLTLADVQLAIKASYASATNQLLIAGQLTPDSFILAPECHLTGGFAVAAWFGPSPHAGEFVVTLGGYNSKYDVPSHYPVPPRVGIDWKVNEHVQITGGLYLALTPKALMAGGGLKAVWTTTDVEAWFRLQADFLMNFAPMSYDLTAVVELGGRVTVRLLLVNDTLDLHLATGLRVWGPDFSVVVEVDLTIISFTLQFGDAQKDGPKTISWEQFVKDFLNAPLKGAPGALADPSAFGPLRLNAARGLLSSLTEESGKLNWIVDPEAVELLAESAAPFKTIVVVEGTGVRIAPDRLLPATEEGLRTPFTGFGVKPVGLEAENFVSELSTVSVTYGRPASAKPAKAAANGDWIATPSLSNVSRGLWGDDVKDGVGDPMSETTYRDCLTALRLHPSKQPARDPIRVRASDLDFTDTDAGPFAQGTPTTPPAHSFEPKDTVLNTIESSAGQRLLMVRALNRLGCRVNPTENVAVLAKANETYLTVEPNHQLLGN